ncbi:unnamed protein product [Polarella glacialis]|uniref:Uncharacterized protein n=1 Tax=Polarella glacialis TaxID=89957 RepID=A0A813DCH7_POLGL|nr:unnamed protein product [Polarella glacialis]CAE8599977.1 unnamed protein product [Polarella glacialis]
MDLAKVFQGLQAAIGIQQDVMPHFLLFDFGPSRLPIIKCSHVVTAPMNMEWFHGFSRQLLQGPPANLFQQEAMEVTSYSARRVSPTIAHLAKFSDGDKRAIGGWLDKEVQIAANKAAQPDRFSGKRLHVALDAKIGMAEVGRAAAMRIGRPVKTMKWEDIAMAFLRTDERLEIVRNRRGGLRDAMIPVKTWNNPG